MMQQNLGERCATTCSALLNVAPDCNRVGKQIVDVDAPVAGNADVEGGLDESLETFTG